MPFSIASGVVPVLMLLTGATAAAQPIVIPPVLEFPVTIVGTAAAPANMTVMNRSAGPIEITGVSINWAASSQFRFTDPGAVTLLAGHTLTIPVTYEPLATGLHSASFVVTSLGFAPVSARINGVAAMPQFQESDAWRDFGDVPVGSTSEPFPVLLRNIGGVAADIMQITSLDAFAVDTTGPPATQLVVDPGVTTQFNVRFSPRAVGTVVGTVDVLIKHVNGPVFSVRAKGNGVMPADLGMAMPSVSGCAVAPAAASRGFAVFPFAFACALAVRRRVRRRRNGTKVASTDLLSGDMRYSRRLHLRAAGDRMEKR